MKISLENGKTKLVVSKKEWESMDNNLSKEAMAYPVTDELARGLGEKGIYDVSDIERKYPKGGIKEHDAILQETGADKIFGPEGIKARKWYVPRQKNIVMIDGKEYFLLHVQETGTSGRGKDKVAVPGKVIVIGPIVRDVNGQVDYKKTDYRKKELPYDNVKDQIARSPQVVKENIDEMNKYINKYNEFVDAQKEKTKGATVTILPLQIKWAEDLIKDRLNELIAQKKGLEASKGQKEDVTQDASGALSSILEGVRGGQIKNISPQDYAVLLLERKFHSIPSLEELKGEINNEKMPFDEKVNSTLKSYLLKVIDWQIAKRKDDKEEEPQEAVLPEMKNMFLEKVKNIEMLPGKYDKAPGYYSPYGMQASGHEATSSIDEDFSDLTAILGSLERSRHTIIDLPQATNEFLRGDGALRLQQVKVFANDATKFFERYKTTPFIETEAGLQVNPRLFGRHGTMGNALIAIILRQVIISVNKEIDRINAGGTPPSVEPGKKPIEEKKEEKTTQEAKGKIDIQKLSGALWQTFERRMKPKL
jgi:hypothetical protein